MDDLHTVQAALALALITMGLVLALLGAAEWKEYSEHQRWKERNRDRNFDIEN